jgi:hypothetical protein
MTSISSSFCSVALLLDDADDEVKDATAAANDVIPMTGLREFRGEGMASKSNLRLWWDLVTGGLSGRKGPPPACLRVRPVEVTAVRDRVELEGPSSEDGVLRETGVEGGGPMLLEVVVVVVEAGFEVVEDTNRTLFCLEILTEAASAAAATMLLVRLLEWSAWMFCLSVIVFPEEEFPRDATISGDWTSCPLRVRGGS